MNFGYRNQLTVPAAILIVILVGLAARWIAQPVWSEQFSVVGGQQDIVKTDELAAAVDELRKQIVSEHLSTASSLVESQQGEDAESVRVTVGRHFGIWAILPALVTLGFCISFREPLPALVLGITVGAFILGRYDLTDEVFLPGLASTRSAGIVLLYLWLLGGLLGIWSRTGAAIAFADWTCRNFVRGPRTAKLVAWFLGVLFFQGGTVSTVLVGTTVRPITDANRISKEELSYIVDSTASPIASLIAFNAWPGYVQSLIFVPGVAYLATESDRIGFFFKCAPLSLYSIFAVLGTFLLAIDRAPVLGRRFRDAIARARASDEADTVNMTRETESPSGSDPTYHSHPLEFVIPLVALIAIAVGTGFLVGSPQVRWAFAAALVIAGGTAICRGMTLTSLVEGIGEGLKGVTVASVILVLAVVLGGITTELGGGLYLSSAIGDNIPRLAFPATLFVLTGIIAFSTGTSWGTYAIAFPLTMPLAITLASTLPADAGQWFVMICFAAVLNGSVFGDQCSPISDTTILSSLVSGCDLMQHVRTQLVPALVAGVLAMVAWTALTAAVT
jgi:Na+/H+ antiporter NhaC